MPLPGTVNPGLSDSVIVPYVLLPFLVSAPAFGQIVHIGQPFTVVFFTGCHIANAATCNPVSVDVDVVSNGPSLPNVTHAGTMLPMLLTEIMAYDPAGMLAVQSTQRY